MIDALWFLAHAFAYAAAIAAALLILGALYRAWVMRAFRQGEHDPYWSENMGRSFTEGDDK